MFFVWQFLRSQIRQTLKKKAFEEAGIPVKQVSATSGGQSTQKVVKQEPKETSSLLNASSEEMMLTLNRINTQESEVDVEGLSSEVKLEFENTSEVAG